MSGKVGAANQLGGRGQVSSGPKLMGPQQSVCCPGSSQPGAVVSSSLCETCRCELPGGPLSDTFVVSCEAQICNSHCPVVSAPALPPPRPGPWRAVVLWTPATCPSLPQGFEYQEQSGQCCGTCVQVACVTNTSGSSAHLFYVSNGCHKEEGQGLGVLRHLETCCYTPEPGMRLAEAGDPLEAHRLGCRQTDRWREGHSPRGLASLQPGETWSDPGNHCVTYECEKHLDGLVVVTTKKACPPLSCSLVRSRTPAPAKGASAPDGFGGL